MSATDSCEDSEKKIDEFLTDSETNAPILERANTVRNANDLSDTSQNLGKVKGSKELKCPERTQSQRKLAECISTADDEEWSALDGVTRVNSLLNLPRYLTGDRKVGVLRKWL